MKHTTEQNKTDSRGEHMKSHPVLFCSAVPFIIVAAVSVVAVRCPLAKTAITVKTNIHCIT